VSYPSRRFLRKPDLFGDTPYLRRLIIATSVSFAQNLVTAESIIDKRLRHYLRQDIWHMFYLRFDIKSRGAFRMKTSRLCKFYFLYWQLSHADLIFSFPAKKL